MKLPNYCNHYSDAIRFIKDNNLENDTEIKECVVEKFKSPQVLFEIARCCFKNRVEEFELVIGQSRFITLLYSLLVIQGKLPEIMHNIMLADYIANNSKYSKAYFNYLNNNQKDSYLNDIKKWFDLKQTI